MFEFKKVQILSLKSKNSQYISPHQLSITMTHHDSYIPQTQNKTSEQKGSMTLEKIHCILQKDEKLCGKYFHMHTLKLTFFLLFFVYKLRQVTKRKSLNGHTKNLFLCPQMAKVSNFYYFIYSLLGFFFLHNTQKDRTLTHR